MSDRFLIGKSINNKSFYKTRKKIKFLKSKVLKKFEDYDFFLTPTLSFGPPTIKTLKNNDQYKFYNNEALNNTRGVNIFDLCAISLPLNISVRKWLSVSIISRKNNDNELLAVAEKIESIL